VTVVRVGLILFGLASGVGVAAYVAAWLLVPADDEPTSIGARAARDRRGLALAAALAPALLLTVFMASLLKAGWLASLAWPTSASTAGLVLVWRNGSEAERGLLRRAAASVVQLGSGNNHRASRHPHAGVVARLGAGLVLIGAGAGLLSVGHRSPLYTPVGGVALVLAGFVVLFGPWWLGIARDLVLERQARVRAEEARTWPPECTTRSFRPWP